MVRNKSIRINTKTVPMMRKEIEELKKEKEKTNNIVSKGIISSKINKLERNIMKESARKY